MTEAKDLDCYIYIVDGVYAKDGGHHAWNLRSVWISSSRICSRSSSILTRLGEGTVRGITAGSRLHALPRDDALCLLCGCRAQIRDLRCFELCERWFPAQGPGGKKT